MPTERWIVEVHSVEATIAWGRTLGECFVAGDVLALIGELGAGKTHFTKGVAIGLGLDAVDISSPTFTLISEYTGRLTLRHCDAYRLRDPREFADLGLDALFAEDGVAIIEWADRVLDDLPRDRIELRITATGETSRQLAWTATHRQSRERLQQLQERVL
jgi:tRNA threonylcarbamoyladenosine biosynthesis protein TsaE